MRILTFILTLLLCTHSWAIDIEKFSTLGSRASPNEFAQTSFWEYDPSYFSVIEDTVSFDISYSTPAVDAYLELSTPVYFTSGKKVVIDFEFSYFSDYSTRRLMMAGLTKDRFFRTDPENSGGEWFGAFKQPEGIFLMIHTVCFGCENARQDFVYELMVFENGNTYTLFNTQGEGVSWDYGRYKFEVENTGSGLNVKFYRFDSGTWTLIKEKEVSIDFSNVPLKYKRVWCDRFQDYSIQGAYKGTVHEIDISTSTSSQNNPPSISSFTANPTSGEAPLEVTFTCAASDPDGDSLKYLWDFDGDGNIDKTTYSSSVSYTYEESGTYNAQVTVEDSQQERISSSLIRISVNSEIFSQPQISGLSAPQVVYPSDIFNVNVSLEGTLSDVKLGMSLIYPGGVIDVPFILSQDLTNEVKVSLKIPPNTRSGEGNIICKLWKGSDVVSSKELRINIAPYPSATIRILSYPDRVEVKNTINIVSEIENTSNKDWTYVVGASLIHERGEVIDIPYVSTLVKAGDAQRVLQQFLIPGDTKMGRYDLKVCLWQDSTFAHAPIQCITETLNILSNIISIWVPREHYTLNEKINLHYRARLDDVTEIYLGGIKENNDVKTFYAYSNISTGSQWINGYLEIPAEFFGVGKWSVGVYLRDNRNIKIETIPITISDYHISSNTFPPEKSFPGFFYSGGIIEFTIPHKGKYKGFKYIHEDSNTEVFFVYKENIIDPSYGAYTLESIDDMNELKAVTYYAMLKNFLDTGTVDKWQDYIQRNQDFLDTYNVEDAIIAATMINVGSSLIKFGILGNLGFILGNSAHIEGASAILNNVAMVIALTADMLTQISTTFCSDTSPLKTDNFLLALSEFGEPDILQEMDTCILNKLSGYSSDLSDFASFLLNTYSIYESTTRSTTSAIREYASSVGKSTASVGISMLPALAAEIAIEQIRNTIGLRGCSDAFVSMVRLNHSYYSLVELLLYRILNARSKIEDPSDYSFKELYDTLGEYAYYLLLYRNLYLESMVNTYAYLYIMNNFIVCDYLISEGDLTDFQENIIALKEAIEKEREELTKDLQAVELVTRVY